ncbi:AfsR/SARP family transcriptional regulator [Streptomyces sp. NPDC044780]|uniref:AfsR/SARP family transcriptional regulator n=1 Tax=unclassified Streptomyces TaxID=2593676 RepID=UPI0033C70DB8
MSDLRFSLLGPVRAWFGGEEIDIGPPQQRAMLAVLLLRLGEPITGENAVRALWDDKAPSAAEGTVRTYIYRLRHRMTDVVGADRLAIRTCNGGYQLTLHGATIDTHLFQQLLADARRARAEDRLDEALDHYYACLQLWRGVPIAGTYTSYFSDERERLQQLRFDAVEEFATVAISLGEHAKAVPILKMAVATQPLREKLWEVLILALFGLGRRADALAAYQDARRVLKTELGLEPTPALRELHRRILASESFRPAMPVAAELFRPAASVPRSHIADLSLWHGWAEGA